MNSDAEMNTEDGGSSPEEFGEADCFSEEEDEEIVLDTSDNDTSYAKEDKKSENEVLDNDLLEAEMNTTIADVQAVLQVDPGVCRILLHKYKWNKESLLERLYEHPDTIAFLIDAQVIPRQQEVIPAGDAECDICCSMDELSGLSCNHRACAECWQAYLTNKIVSDAQSEIECMAPNCKLLIEDEKVLSYISDPTMVSKYRKLMVASYVEINCLLRWCPGIDCGKAVKVSHWEPRLVVCSCGTCFCFSCGQNWHEPLNCRHLKKWIKKCQDDSETMNWINANTKDCPKCMIPIEKNGGCNRMLCTNSGCRYEFCWMCLEPWTKHGYQYACNGYDETAVKNPQDAQEISRANLKRYLFYFNRYMGHEQSLQLEGKLNIKVAKKMEQMENMSMSWIEVQFLRKAVDILSECRRTLMYTYAFAFYLKKDNNSIIFESNQANLEMETEQLSGFLERDLEDEDLVTLKQKVQDKYRYVEQRRKVLLDHCAEGAEQDIWQYND